MSVAMLQETIKSISAKNPHRLSKGILYIFYCLDEISVPKKKNSTILSFTFPIFFKCRSGQIYVPDCGLVLLTLLLVNWIDEIKAAWVRWKLCFKPKLKTIRRSLLQLKLIELTLPPQSGRTKFCPICEWWSLVGGHSLTTPSMASYLIKRGV